MVKPCILFGIYIFFCIGLSLCLSISNPNVAFAADHSADSSSGWISVLQSSSSSESLATYRNVINAENEAEIYERIRALENACYYNLPPQNNQGEYEALVKGHFDLAIDVNHYVYVYDIEFFGLRALEGKALLQDRLFDLMLAQPNLDRILELSAPYTDIRKEAYFFLEDKLGSASALDHSEERRLFETQLNCHIDQIKHHGKHSQIYREFYRNFTNEDFRREHGLPLP